MKSGLQKYFNEQEIGRTVESALIRPFFVSIDFSQTHVRSVYLNTIYLIIKCMNLHRFIINI